MKYSKPTYVSRVAVMVCCLLTVYSISTTAAAAPPSDGIAILPAEVVLRGKEASHRLLVQTVAGGELTQQVEKNITWTSSNPKSVVVNDGVVTPMAGGEAIITARVGEQIATAKVLAKAMDQPHQWSFRNHVLAVMTKAGCNGGACHGALAGKGGFKLSLRGYDPPADHHTITRQARGRRIELSDPGRSLLLAKPSGAIPHKGGLRFDVGSKEYQILSQWVAAAAPPPTEGDAQLENLEVLPATVVLKPGQTQQIVVRAHYSDGRVEDVTRFAKYASTNEAVLKTDDQGRANVIGRGEGAVTAWFSQKIAIARITVPYDNQIAKAVFDKAPRRNFIDNLVLKQLRRLNLPPSPPADDATFLRRAFLDTIGLLPTEKETREFLADLSPNKRDRIIDELLSRPEFVDYWTYKWSDVLMINGTLLRPQAVKAYYDWIRGHVKANTRWDEFVREVVTAQGDSFDNGAVNFYSLHQDPETMTENACQAFLGLSIGCAKCHNHPLEKWTNNQYYAMANLFARVRAKGWGGDPRSGDGRRTVYVAAAGDLIQPLTGKPQPPTPLDGRSLPFEDPGDRRIHLARWLTSPQNSYFARSIANRVWANFMGVGLVEPIDDMRTSNPATNEELLSALGDYLVKNKFDLKELMRAVLQSKTYQLSSRPLKENQEERRFYSRYYPRRLMAEVLLDAISQATQVPTDFTHILFPGADREKTNYYPKGTRALQLYDSAVDSYFLKTFGRNQRRITCECERTDEPSMVQVLHISNGDTVNQKLQAKDNRIDQLLAASLPGTGLRNYQIIDRAYLVCLSRHPTDQEMERMLGVMNRAPAKEKRLVVEDLFWAILSSREFLFNH